MIRPARAARRRDGFAFRRSREGRESNPSRISRRIRLSKAMSGSKEESFPDIGRYSAFGHLRRAESRMLLGVRLPPVSFRWAAGQTALPLTVPMGHRPARLSGPTRAADRPARSARPRVHPSIRRFSPSVLSAPRLTPVLGPQDTVTRCVWLHVPRLRQSRAIPNSYTSRIPGLLHPLLGYRPRSRERCSPLVSPRSPGPDPSSYHQPIQISEEPTLATLQGSRLPPRLR